MAVTGLDTSAGAIEVARERGLRDTVLNTVDEYARSAARYDTFLLLGNNLGLLESRERAPVFLAALAAPGRTRAPGSSRRAPTRTAPPTRCTSAITSGTARAAGSAGSCGCGCATACWPPTGSTTWSARRTSCESLLEGTRWRLKSIDDADHPYYLAVMELTE